MTSAQDYGKRGEEIAMRFLVGLGYEIRGRNVRLMRDEIDIVAFDVSRQMMVFVEVKTRRRSSETYPIRTSVDRRKKSAMKRAVARWVIANEYDEAGRIDLLCVEGERVVEHIMDIGAKLY
ncbi:MAG: YraN family protein [Candidatus Peribacteraceae bacterium]|nr:YraN family protein [Candidatus Peribacteraceae bacterium]